MTHLGQGEPGEPRVEPGRRKTSFTAVITATFAGLLADSGLTPAQVRERIMDDRPFWSEEIYRRAAERGEIDLDRMAMPFDLMRHDLLMTLRPIPPERIKSIVDDLFLPLATGGTAAGGTAAGDAAAGGTAAANTVAGDRAV